MSGRIYELSVPRSRKLRQPGVFWVDGTDRCFATRAGFELVRGSARILREFPWQESGLEIRREYPEFMVDEPPAEVAPDVLAMALARNCAAREEVPVYLGRAINTENIPGAFVHDRFRGRRRYVWAFLPAEEFDEEQRVRRFACDRLRERILDPETRVALSFGSGALRAVLHQLIIKLLQGLGVAEHVDEAWGTSAGSIAALLFSSGVPAREMEEKLYQLYRRETRFGFSPKPWDLYRGLVRPLFRKEGARALGIFDTKMIESLLPWLVGQRERRVPFFAVTYNATHYRREILTPDKLPELSHGIYEEINQVALADAICASCTVPGLFRPRFIERRGVRCHFYDGALCEQVPLEPVVDRFLADRRLGREKRPRLFLIAANVIHPRLDAKTTVEKPLSSAHGLFAQVLLASQSRAKLRFIRTVPEVSVLFFDFGARDYGGLKRREIPEILREGQLDLVDSLLEFAQT